jgi:hypothetical protein
MRVGNVQRRAGKSFILFGLFFCFALSIPPVFAL